MDLSTGVQVVAAGQHAHTSVPVFGVGRRGLAAEWPNNRGDLSPLLPGHYVTIDRRGN